MKSNLERKIVYSNVIFYVVGLIIPLFLFIICLGNLCLMIAILLWIVGSWFTFAYFQSTIIEKEKYIDCKWDEYSSFVNLGFPWTGKRVYYFKGIRRQLEQMECDLAVGNYKSVADDISNIDSQMDTTTIGTTRNDKRIKNIYQRKKCRYYFETGNQSTLEAEADIARMFIPEKDMAQIDIYQKLLKGDKEGAKTKLKSIRIEPYNYHIAFWHSLMAQSEIDFGKQKGHWNYVEELNGELWIRQIAIKKLDELNDVTAKEVDQPQLQSVSHKPYIVVMLIFSILIIINLVCGFLI